MGVAEGYLYGDSTPSPIKTDFVAFLRAALDFGVLVLQADARAGEAKQAVHDLAQSTEREIADAEAFGAEVARALERAPIGDAQSLTARCAARIHEGALDLIRAEAEAARLTVEGEKGRVAQRVAAERDACSKAFASLLLANELPEETGLVVLRGKAGAHYDAQYVGQTPYGFDWTLALEVPGSSPLAQIMKVERVVERLEVEAPEESGWIRKETKIRPQRLDRLYVAEVRTDRAETAVKLRAVPDGTGDGFDLAWRREPASIQIVRVAEGAAAADAPYTVKGEDAKRLETFRDRLVTLVSGLVPHKKAILLASVDGTPVDQLESPRVLVDRLIAFIAPAVQEMGRRSLTPGELVLKRVMGDSQREELFVTRAELLQKLEALPPSARRSFDALRLFERPGPSSVPEPPRGHMETLPHGTPEPDDVDSLLAHVRSTADAPEITEVSPPEEPPDGLGSQ
jgi:hypothetical protein